MKNTFFEPANKLQVYDSVGYYLRSMSQKSGSPVVKTETKGWYKLNPDNEKVQQLVMDFSIDDNDQWMI